MPFEERGALWSRRISARTKGSRRMLPIHRGLARGVADDCRRLSPPMGARAQIYSRITETPPRFGTDGPDRSRKLFCGGTRTRSISVSWPQEQFKAGPFSTPIRSGSEIYIRRPLPPNWLSTTSSGCHPPAWRLGSFVSSAEPARMTAKAASPARAFIVTPMPVVGIERLSHGPQSLYEALHTPSTAQRGALRSDLPTGSAGDPLFSVRCHPK